MRGITYKLQERPLGGLSKSIIRKLERLNLDSEASDAQKPERPISLKAGTRLVREWRGVTYTVLVQLGRACSIPNRSYECRCHTLFHLACIEPHMQEIRPSVHI
jgi:Protein of unknown function (DUF2924)